MFPFSTFSTENKRKSQHTMAKKRRQKYSTNENFIALLPYQNNNKLFFQTVLYEEISSGMGRLNLKINIILVSYLFYCSQLRLIYNSPNNRYKIFISS